MTSTEQRIAIATACGWRDVRQQEIEYADIGSRSVSIYSGIAGTAPDGDRRMIPDYLNDLNAMHEAEKILTREQFFAYSGTLAEMCGNSWHFATIAKASIRAEAFLRALSLWTETK